MVRQNPWWTDEGWEPRDPHLRRLARQPRQLPAPLVERLDLRTPGLHTIRGPRQVGKSTDLKLLARRALAEGWGPRGVVYLSLDLLQDRPLSDVAAAIAAARSSTRAGGPKLLLLDEVTAVRDWQVVAKSLWDDGVIDHDVVVCTGSSAIDLARGTAERLPGRRGAGSDHLVLPQSFSSFARALTGSLPPSPGLHLAALRGPAGREVLEEAALHLPALDHALELYLRFGGLPAAVAEAASGAVTPSEGLLRLASDALARELRRAGASEPATFALLERVLRSLGSRTSWSRMSQEMDVPLRARPGRAATAERRTVRDYVELLGAGYFVLIVYFWRPGSDSNAVSKDKKLYFGDPLLATLAHEHAPGFAPDVPALVENALALAAYRRYEAPALQFQGFTSPSDLHVWGTARGGEIDLVCGPRARIDALEVKYQRRIDRRAAVAVSRAFPGRPAVIATRDTLDLRDAYQLVPASLLLWVLS